jgi:hypothetical protein
VAPRHRPAHCGRGGHQIVIRSTSSPAGHRPDEAPAVGWRGVDYRLRVDPEQVDALRFTRLLDAAAQAADPASQRARLAAALALWRGDPFDGVASDWLARTETPRLAERYLTAVERTSTWTLPTAAIGSWSASCPT